jgi:hypothetical protein
MWRAWSAIVVGPKVTDAKFETGVGQWMENRAAGVLREVERRKKRGIIPC